MIALSEALSGRINAEEPEAGEALIWWLGQSGFIVKCAGVSVGIDLYLTTTIEDATRDQPLKRHIRMMPIPVPPEKLRCLDFILCTHSHRDHYDEATVRALLRGSPGAKLIAPPECAEKMCAAGFRAVLPLGAGETCDQGDFTVAAIKSSHNGFDYSEEYGYPFVGYLMDFGTLRIYHSGDTVWFAELPGLVARARPDLAILPINGGTPELIARGFRSNLDFRQAAGLCLGAGVRHMIPCHYDMFTINTEQVGKFVNLANRMGGRLSYWVPVVGEPCRFRKEGFCYEDSL